MQATRGATLGAPPTPASAPRRTLLLAVTAVVVLVADVVSKVAIVATVTPGRRIHVIGTLLQLTELRKELEEQERELRGEITEAESAWAALQRDSGEGSGDDQADAGTKTFEREHEMSLAANSRDLLSQVERALQRLDNGTYGVCENCGNPIGKARLQAFPRATLCVSCKQREERR